ncbi:MAG: hypothetical protein ACXW13_00230 [Burkholderiaceae bacterium]
MIALAVCLALQPVVALGAETMNAERRQQYRNPSAEAQRYRELPNSGQPESGRKQGDVAKSCIPMRTGNPNGVASQEANRPGGLRNDCEPGTEPRGRAPKVTVAQNPTKGIAPGPGDAIERGKQRAERTR